MLVVGEGVCRFIGNTARQEGSDCGSDSGSVSWCWEESSVTSLLLSKVWPNYRF